MPDVIIQDVKIIRII